MDVTPMYATKACGGVEIQFYPFLTSAVGWERLALQGFSLATKVLFPVE